MRHSTQRGAAATEETAPSYTSGAAERSDRRAAMALTRRELSPATRIAPLEAMTTLGESHR